MSHDFRGEKRRVCAWAVLCLLGISSPLSANLIANNGFETGSAVNGNVPTSFGAWQGDQAAFTTAENGITPAEGSRMLKFIATNAGGPAAATNTSQYFQNIDLTPYAATINAGNARLSAQALFNRITGDAQTDTAFGIQVFARSGTPSSFATLAAASDVLFSDALQGTWEAATITDFLLPVGTTFVLFELDAFENVVNNATLPEYDGHYADNVVVTVVPEPGACVLILSVLVVAFRTRSRR